MDMASRVWCFSPWHNMCIPVMVVWIWSPQDCHQVSWRFTWRPTSTACRRKPLKFPVAVSSKGTVPLNESLPESSRRTGTTVDKPVKQEERSDDTKTSPQRTEPKLDMGKLTNNVAGAASSSQSAHAQHPQCATGGTSNRESLRKKDQEAEEKLLQSTHAQHPQFATSCTPDTESLAKIESEEHERREKKNFNECAIVDAFKHNRTEHQPPDDYNEALEVDEEPDQGTEESGPRRLVGRGKKNKIRKPAPWTCRLENERLCLHQGNRRK